MSDESKPIGGEVFTKPFKVLMAFALFAAVLVIIRFVYGLGKVTNLSDGYPWGIWITYDVVAGTAIACGGYAMAILVYVINKGEYHPLVRPALLASMFGYTLAGVSVMFDIGRYWQAYDDDILHAAAWLHDLGVFIGHRPEELEALQRWDHIAYAIGEAPGILRKVGFPEGRITAVCEAIRTHLPTSRPNSLEGTLLREADILAVVEG